MRAKLFSMVRRASSLALREEPVPRQLVERVVTARVPTVHGTFDVSIFHEIDAAEKPPKDHLAITFGEVSKGPVLCRLHSECLTGDVLGSKLCDCGEQLDQGMERIARAGGGIVLYLRQEGRGIGLPDKLRAYNLQRTLGVDTVEANRMLGRGDDERDFGIAGAMLKDLGVDTVRLLTNNPLKAYSLTEQGITVDEIVPMVPVDVSAHNIGYLRTKIERMGHTLSPDDLAHR